MGSKLYATFRAAGLEPRLHGSCKIESGPNSITYDFAAETLRTLVPAMEEFGIASAEEVGVDILADRLRRQRCPATTAFSFPASSEPGRPRTAPPLKLERARRPSSHPRSIHQRWRFLGQPDDAPDSKAAWAISRRQLSRGCPPASFRACSRRSRSRCFRPLRLREKGARKVKRNSLKT